MKSSDPAHRPWLTHEPGHRPYTWQKHGISCIPPAPWRTCGARPGSAPPTCSGSRSAGNHRNPTKSHDPDPLCPPAVRFGQKTPTASMSKSWQGKPENDKATVERKLDVGDRNRLRNQFRNLKVAAVVKRGRHLPKKPEQIATILPWPKTY